ncbi:hypothetical protein SteCoe_30437 [Stentor coeruleus]|uniref:Uncharacterized protein n=1 Tax=Stentor coeruleus TaxID=5963 RepID=A0A1R2B3Y1_9CILI|nr:hypothetical protein SteCoe_30437 [Stentor coeruleus]
MTDGSDKWYLEYCNRIHKEKLKKIQKESGRRIDNTEPETYKIMKNKIKPSASKGLLSQYNILLENKVILSKITEISNKPGPLSKAASFSGPGTLNLPSRLQSMKAIEEQNMHLLKKIKNKESILSFKKMDKDYYELEKIKKLISKKPSHQIIGNKSHKKLPPLIYPEELQSRTLKPLITERNEPKDDKPHENIKRKSLENYKEGKSEDHDLKVVEDKEQEEKLYEENNIEKHKEKNLENPKEEIPISAN